MTSNCRDDNARLSRTAPSALGRPVFQLPVYHFPTTKIVSQISRALLFVLLSLFFIECILTPAYILSNFVSFDRI